MKVLCIGHAAYDITMQMDKFPLENSKSRTNKKVESTGGGALTQSITLSKWGNKTYFLGCVGNDYFGDQILKTLNKNGVYTKYLDINKYKETSRSFVLVTPNGKRTTYTYCDNVKMKKVKLNFKPDVILVDGHEFDVSFDVIKKYKDAISIIDASRVDDDTLDLCKLVDYVVCSKDFATNLTNKKINYSNFSSLTKIYNILEEMFKTNIVITLEDKGCLCKIDNEIKIISSIDVEPIDTTGAGDIFHGAFAHYIMRKRPLEEVLRLSNIAGALSTLYSGTINSIVNIEEVEEKYNELR